MSSFIKPFSTKSLCDFQCMLLGPGSPKMMLRQKKYGFRICGSCKVDDIDHVADKYGWQRPHHREVRDLNDLAGCPGEIAQTFSHYSYIYTQREHLVVDLQGKVLQNGSKQVIKLTDPAIHTFDEGGQRRHFGLTDKGQNGIREFFRRHQCNALCQNLGLQNKVGSQRAGGRYGTLVADQFAWQSQWDGWWNYEG